jgi:hypothetical protein
MSVSAVQQARRRSAAQSSLPPRTTLRSADGFDLTLGGDLLAWVIPSDQRAYLGLDGGTDSFAPAILPVPTFGKSRPGYLSIKPWISAVSDDQHASPAGVAGLARIPGSNDA